MVDETGLDELKVDETAVDEIAVDEPGPHRLKSKIFQGACPQTPPSDNTLTPDQLNIASYGPVHTVGTQTLAVTRRCVNFSRAFRSFRLFHSAHSILLCSVPFWVLPKFFNCSTGALFPGLPTVQY